MQTSVYVNTQQGKRTVSSLDQGNPAVGLLILSECLLVPPLVRDLQRKVMDNGAAYCRGCMLVNRVDTNRGDILHYIVWSDRHFFVVIIGITWGCVPLASARGSIAVAAFGLGDVGHMRWWARACDAVRSANGAPVLHRPAEEEFFSEDEFKSTAKISFHHLLPKLFNIGI